MMKIKYIGDESLRDFGEDFESNYYWYKQDANGNDVYRRSNTFTLSIDSIDNQWVVSITEITSVYHY